ncbi:hypothetical protein HWV62_13421 [Athelia sp. TMB]|nr:hypothetical protein HWV62_13421 [Athelia sp. TMB]
MVHSAPLNGHYLQTSMPPIDEEDPDLSLSDIFTEPPRPPTPEPTVTIYERDPESHKAFQKAVPDIAADNDWDKIEIKLVGKTELWGHYLWNAARAFTTFLDENPQNYRGRNVLELGAGGGLPGIVAAKNGARKVKSSPFYQQGGKLIHRATALKVVLTDYDEPLINNLKDNIKANFGISRPYGEDGHDSEDRISAIASDNHIALLKSCLDTLAPHASNKLDEDEASVPAPAVLVFYSHHVPKYADRDLRFFEEAKERGWVCKEMAVEKYPPMFPEDPGSEEVRSTVHRWKLTR